MKMNCQGCRTMNGCVMLARRAAIYTSITYTFASGQAWIRSIVWLTNN